jgi:VWFA-related protein
MKRPSINVGALLLLFAAPLTQSQAISIPPAPADSPSQSSVTLHQTVNNVLIDVVVSDKSGQPVKGLTKDKFQVAENGAPQQISFFEEHQAGPPPVPPAHPLQLPPNVYTNFTSAAPDTSPMLVLLMDALNTPSADQVKVRLAMLAFLRQVPQGRHIAIFILTSRLHMIQGFNSDPATLIAALDQAAAWQKQSHLTDNPGQDTYADSMPKLGIGSSASAAGDVFQSFVSHEQSWRMDQRVDYTLDAFNSLATYLSALPGRKNLIWFSGSFPFGLGADSATPQGAGDFHTESLDRLRDYSAQLHSTSDLLTLARVAVYPVDPTALPTPSMFSTTQNNNGSLHNNSAGISQITQESSDELSSHATMDTIAESTGGRAFHETNDLAAAISTISQLNSDYYTLVYVPTDKNYDGKFRKLLVKVDVPKVKLDYRRGYYAQDPAKTGADKLAHPAHTTSVLLHGAPAAADIVFKIRVAPKDAIAQPGTSEPSPAPPNTARYSINWVVDLHGVNLPPASNGLRRGAINLVAVAYDRDGKARNSTTSPVSLILKPEEYASYLKTGLQFHQELDLPLGSVYLRLAIVDTANDRAGATEIPLTVQAAAAQTSVVQRSSPH